MQLPLLVFIFFSIQIYFVQLEGGIVRTVHIAKFFHGKETSDFISSDPVSDSIGITVRYNADMQKSTVMWDEMMKAAGGSIFPNGDRIQYNFTRNYHIHININIHVKNKSSQCRMCGWL
jgi:hypothetical protein